ncbi:MAG: guanine deaminase [Bacteroidota bacterium]|nr:guanine deaminase [Bacteroidota bacterium]
MNALPFRLSGPILSPQSPSECTWYPSGTLAIGEHGRILFCGPCDTAPEDIRTLPAITTDDIILPGFVDLHTHLPQYDARGKFGVTLLEWLERFIYPEEERFADEESARDISRRFFRALLQAGTTTAFVYAPVQFRAAWVAFEEAERSRLRVVLGKTQMDRNAPFSLLESTHDSLRDAERLIEAWHRKNGRLFYAVTPRFAPTCTPVLLRRCALLAERHGTFIQTHANESLAEIARVRELFPQASSYLDIYANAGLLCERTIIAHNIHVSDDDLALCERTRCAIAHCPDSNLFLGSGRFPLERYAERDIRIGLGSDVGAGTTLFMPQIMRSMAWVQQRSLHPFIPLYHATAGGAAALGRECDTGTLEKGKCADLVTIRVDGHFSGGKTLEKLSAVEIASAIVYRTQPCDIRSVWVEGERLYEYQDEKR